MHCRRDGGWGFRTTAAGGLPGGDGGGRAEAVQAKVDEGEGGQLWFGDDEEEKKGKKKAHPEEGVGQLWLRQAPAREGEL